MVGDESESALVAMSTLTEVGVGHVKQVACDRLLNSRVELKLKVRAALTCSLHIESELFTYRV